MEAPQSPLQEWDSDETHSGWPDVEECERQLEDEAEWGEWKPSHQFSKAETLIIFDYDDTLCPSSWLERNGLLSLNADIVVPHEVRDVLDRLSPHVCNTLSKAHEFGRVAIVTAGQDGWVELSSEKFLPKVKEVIDKLGIYVMSARTSYESAQAPNPVHWKVLAFTHLIDGAAREVSDKKSNTSENGEEGEGHQDEAKATQNQRAKARLDSLRELPQHGLMDQSVGCTCTCTASSGTTLDVSEPTTPPLNATDKAKDGKPSSSPNSSSSRLQLQTSIDAPRRVSCPIFDPSDDSEETSSVKGNLLDDSLTPSALDLVPTDEQKGATTPNVPLSDLEVSTSSTTASPTDAQNLEAQWEPIPNPISRKDMSTNEIAAKIKSPKAKKAALFFSKGNRRASMPLAVINCSLSQTAPPPRSNALSEKPKERIGDPPSLKCLKCSLAMDRKGVENVEGGGAPSTNPNGTHQICGKDNTNSDVFALRNVLQFGDSESERHALFQSTRCAHLEGSEGSSFEVREGIYGKSFKFAEDPTPEVLEKEHTLIYSAFNQMVCFKGVLDLEIKLPDSPEQSWSNSGYVSEEYEGEDVEEATQEEGDFYDPEPTTDCEESPSTSSEKSGASTHRSASSDEEARIQVGS
eukprot:GHVN01089305.1.p2 GENE.GHVN01089305.1~~GHVN01089305.1.p2  ORF type:complete len:634 (+),score=114.84 GHVN01089305.1:462-2363(+)